MSTPLDEDGACRNKEDYAEEERNFHKLEAIKKVAISIVSECRATSRNLEKFIKNIRAAKTIEDIKKKHCGVPDD